MGWARGSDEGDLLPRGCLKHYGWKTKSGEPRSSPQGRHAGPKALKGGAGGERSEPNKGSHADDADGRAATVEQRRAWGKGAGSEATVAPPPLRVRPAPAGPPEGGGSRRHEGAGSEASVATERPPQRPVTSGGRSPVAGDAQRPSAPPFRGEGRREHSGAQGGEADRSERCEQPES